MQVLQVAILTQPFRVSSCTMQFTISLSSLNSWQSGRSVKRMKNSSSSAWVGSTIAECTLPSTSVRVNMPVIPKPRITSKRSRASTTCLSNGGGAGLHAPKVSKKNVAAKHVRRAFIQSISVLFLRKDKTIIF